MPPFEHEVRGTLVPIARYGVYAMAKKKDHDAKQRAVVAKILSGFECAPPDDEKGREHYPNLFDVLAPVYEGRRCLRQAGRLTIRAEGGAWQWKIECPTEGLQTVNYAVSLHTLCAEIEQLVAGGLLVWVQTWKEAKKNLPVVDGHI